MKEIDTELAIQFMNLDDSDLSNLNSLIDDFRALYLHIECRKEMFPKTPIFDLIDLNEFIDYCKYKFGCLDKTEVKSSRKFNYSEYLRRYFSLLRQIIERGDMFKELYLKVISQNQEVCDKYKYFINYLSYSYDEKEVVLKNLKKMSEIGIDKFSYDPYEVYDTKYSVVVQENPDRTKDGKVKYCIRGFCTDGNKSWLNQSDVDIYEFSSKKANYVIHYIKGSANQDIVQMKVKNLTFDANSLPSKEEIFDATVLPEINFELINKKTWAVNFNYGASMSLESATDLLEYSNYLLKQLNMAGTRNEYLKLMNQLVLLEPFINTLKEIKDKQLGLIVNDGKCSYKEIHDLTEEKITKEKTRAKYFGRKKKDRNF